MDVTDPTLGVRRQKKRPINFFFLTCDHRVTMLDGEMEQKLKQGQHGNAPEVECKKEEKWKKFRNGQNTDLPLSARPYPCLQAGPNLHMPWRWELLFEREPQREGTPKPPGPGKPWVGRTSLRAGVGALGSSTLRHKKGLCRNPSSATERGGIQIQDQVPRPTSTRPQIPFVCMFRAICY